MAKPFSEAKIRELEWKQEFSKQHSKKKDNGKKIISKIKPLKAKLPDPITKSRSQRSHGGGVGIQTHGNKLASALNTQTPDHSVYLNEDGYLKGGVKVRR